MDLETTKNAQALMRALEITGDWKDYTKFQETPVSQPVVQPVLRLVSEPVGVQLRGRDGRLWPMRDAIESASCSRPGKTSPEQDLQTQQLRELANTLWHTQLASGAEYFVGKVQLRLIQLAMHLQEVVHYEKDGRVYTCQLMACRFKTGGAKSTVEFDLRCSEADLGWTSVPEYDWLEGRSGIIWPRTC